MLAGKSGRYMESQDPPPTKRRSSLWGKIGFRKVAPLTTNGTASFDQLTAHLRAMKEGRGDHYGKSNCGVMVSYDRADEPSVRWLHAEFMKRYE